MAFACDRDDDFVKMPLVAARGRTLADPIGECLAELLPPKGIRVSLVTQIPRAASSSSTMRRLSKIEL
jgi:hypothetical protein